MAIDDLADLPGHGRALTIIGDEFDSFQFSGSLTLNRTETRQGLEFRIYDVDALPGFELAIAAEIALN